MSAEMEQMFFGDMVRWIKCLFRDCVTEDAQKDHQSAEEQRAKQKVEKEKQEEEDRKQKAEQLEREKQQSEKEKHETEKERQQVEKEREEKARKEKEEEDKKKKTEEVEHKRMQKEMKALKFQIESNKHSIQILGQQQIETIQKDVAMKQQQELTKALQKEAEAKEAKEQAERQAKEAIEAKENAIKEAIEAQQKADKQIKDAKDKSDQETKEREERTQAALAELEKTAAEAVATAAKEKAETEKKEAEQKAKIEKETYDKLQQQIEKEARDVKEKEKQMKEAKEAKEAAERKERDEKVANELERLNKENALKKEKKEKQEKQEKQEKAAKEAKLAQEKIIKDAETAKAEAKRKEDLEARKMNAATKAKLKEDLAQKLIQKEKIIDMQTKQELKKNLLEKLGGQSHEKQTKDEIKLEKVLSNEFEKEMKSDEEAKESSAEAIVLQKRDGMDKALSKLLVPGSSDKDLIGSLFGNLASDSSVNYMKTQQSESSDKLLKQVTKLENQQEKSKTTEKDVKQTNYTKVDKNSLDVKLEKELKHETKKLELGDKMIMASLEKDDFYDVGDSNAAYDLSPEGRKLQQQVKQEVQKQSEKMEKNLYLKQGESIKDKIEDINSQLQQKDSKVDSIKVNVDLSHMQNLMGFNSHASSDYSIKDSIERNSDYTANWIKKQGNYLLKTNTDSDQSNALVQSEGMLPEYPKNISMLYKLRI